MRVLAFFLCLLASSVSFAVPGWIIPSPISIALTVGRWMYSEKAQDQVYYIRVQAQGSTEEEARKQAFRLAVEQAVGTLLVSESQTINKELLRHNVVNYSSGIIHDFAYIDSYNQPNKVIIMMDVWVKQSKIANRLALDTTQSQKLPGGRIAENFKSIQRENQDGDTVLRMVLNDYPTRSFDIKTQNVEYQMNNRKPVMILDFDITWKEKYVTALQDALDRVAHKSKAHPRDIGVGITFRGSNYCHVSGLLCSDTIYRTDQSRADMVTNTLYASKPYVMLEILDTHSQLIYKNCFWWGGLQGEGRRHDKLWEAGPQIYNKNTTKGRIHVNLSGYSVDKMDSYNVSIIDQSQCNL